MDIKRATKIVRTLAYGADPTTGKMLPDESVYNSPEVIRALFVLLDAVKHEELPHNAGKPWNEIEDSKLCDEFASKMKISDIAKEHGRSRGAIESRLDHLGLKNSKKRFFLKKNNKI